MMNKRCS